MQNFVYIFFYMQILGAVSYSIQFSGEIETQMGFENNINLG